MKQFFGSREAWNIFFCTKLPTHANVVHNPNENQRGKRKRKYEEREKSGCRENRRKGTHRVTSRGAHIQIASGTTDTRLRSMRMYSKALLPDTLGKNDSFLASTRLLQWVSVCRVSWKWMATSRERKKEREVRDRMNSPFNVFDKKAITLSGLEKKREKMYLQSLQLRQVREGLSVDIRDGISFEFEER